MTTIRDLATKLNVPMGTVAKALIDVGVMRTATQQLSPDDVEYVKKQLHTTPPPPSDDGGASGEGVREPRRPHPPTLSGEALASDDV